MTLKRGSRSALPLGRARSAGGAPARVACSATAFAEPATAESAKQHEQQHAPGSGGHTALLHGLGAMGDVPPAQVPWLLRLVHVQARLLGRDSKQLLEVSAPGGGGPWSFKIEHALHAVAPSPHFAPRPPPAQENARGLLAWHATLQRGLLPDTLVLEQLLLPSTAAGGLGISNEAWAAGQTAEQLACFPCEPLRTMLLRVLNRLGAARFAQKYPAVREALLRSLLEAAVQYHRTLAGEKVPPFP